MPTGILKTLVHLSSQTYTPNTRLVPDHNDKGYGIIEDANGQHVYFSHQAVAGLHGFDDLRQGQQLDYTLESTVQLRAASVSAVAADETIVLKPAT